MWSTRWIRIITQSTSGRGDSRRGELIGVRGVEMTEETEEKEM